MISVQLRPSTLGLLGRRCTLVLKGRFTSYNHETHASSNNVLCRVSRHSRELRGPSAQDVSYFRSVLSRPDRSVLDGTSSQDVRDEIAKYNVDWTKQYRGSSNLVLRPQTTSEVSSILQYCNENCIGITPQGGNTGLCGAATPITTEIILSLEYMNRIYSIDEYSGILTCEAGCILQSLHDFAMEKGYLFPLDIGSKGTCQIGGNVSTNAGGFHFFRFGGLHGNVLGMEVVLPNGRVLSLNIDCGGSDDDDDDDFVRQFQQSSTSLRKDNTGYDLKQLFIGAEGTLGIITKVAIACPALPTSKNVVLLVCNSYNDVLRVLRTAKNELGEILSAIELIDWNTMQFVQSYGAGIGSNLISVLLASEAASKQPLFILVESQGCNQESDLLKMDSFLTSLYESSAIETGFLAQDSKHIHEIWSIRESCNPSVAAAGFVHKFDISCPIHMYMDVAEEVETGLKVEKLQNLTVCVWGHVADGNAHLNVVAPGQFDKNDDTLKRIENIVYSSVMKRKGSISAEHGIGQSKRKYMKQIKDGAVLELMSQIKKLFDPHCIMNPGKYLPGNY